MRLNEVRTGISAAGSKFACWGRKPVVYVEIEDGVFCEVVAIHHYSDNKHPWLPEENQVVIQISEPVPPPFGKVK